MSIVRCRTVTALMMLAPLLQAHVTQAQETDSRPLWDWLTVAPESQGMASAKLEAVWANLQKRHTTALLVIHNDRIVFERYASGYHRTKPHYTASMAKALVGGVGLMLAMHDGRITPDDLAGKYVPQWANDPQRMGITVRHLASHTSGIEDAEANDLPHGELTGWKGDFWKGLPPPNDPFTIARDLAPVCDVPGTKGGRSRHPSTASMTLDALITAHTSLPGSRARFSAEVFVITETIS
jgi:CubicO group peptidase (beta-lactamase class C family)